MSRQASGTVGVVGSRLVEAGAITSSVREASYWPAGSARRLAEAAGLDVSVDPNMSDQSQGRLADAASVVLRACELATAGELDGFIGVFDYRDDDLYASLITRRLDLHVYEEGDHCARVFLECLRDYVASHSFEDDAGHVRLTGKRPSRWQPARMMRRAAPREAPSLARFREPGGQLD